MLIKLRVPFYVEGKKTFSARRKYLLHAYVEFNGYLFIKKVNSR